jgi:hypothetical protein
MEKRIRLHGFPYCIFRHNRCRLGKVGDIPSLLTREDRDVDAQYIGCAIRKRKLLRGTPMPEEGDRAFQKTRMLPNIQIRNNVKILMFKIRDKVGPRPLSFRFGHSALSNACEASPQTDEASAGDGHPNSPES